MALQARGPKHEPVRDGGWSEAHDGNDDRSPWPWLVLDWGLSASIGSLADDLGGKHRAGWPLLDEASGADDRATS
jgi:hypothetical protein